MINIPEATLVAVADITPSPRNTKKHPQSQINNVAKSIQRFGFVQPLVLDENNEIIIGHCRLSAAKKLNMAEVPCVYVKDLSEEDIRALRILDNKLNESEWDFEILAEELLEIDFSDFEDLDFGLEEETDAIESIVEDEVPEIEDEAEPICKLGDVWRLGAHRLMCGDSTSPEDVEKLIGGGVADLVVTDPPYNVDYEGTAGKIQNDDMGSGEFEEFLDKAFSNLANNLKEGGAFYIWHASRTQREFENALNHNNLFVREQIMWNKSSFTLGRSDYQWKHEPCFYGWKDGAAHYFIDDRSQSTVIEDKGIDLKKLKKEEMLKLLEDIFADKISTTVINEDKPITCDLHPTMKPVKLIARLILNSSRMGESVLDLFGGSGTTLIACEQLNRKCYTMEYDPKYADVIIQRWETLTGKKAIKENEKRCTKK